MNLAPESIRTLGAFRSRSGEEHNLFRARTNAGETCIVEDSVTGTTPQGEPLRVYGGGCSASGANDHPVRWSLSTAGGPDAENMDGLRIVGFAEAGVSRIEVVDSDGKINAVELSDAGAFLYEASISRLAAGIEPVRLMAYDRADVRIYDVVLR
jgi:hypothetical protein